MISEVPRGFLRINLMSVPNVAADSQPLDASDTLLHEALGLIILLPLFPPSPNLWLKNSPFDAINSLMPLPGNG